MDTVGIIANCARASAVHCAGDLAAFLAGRELRVLLRADLARALGKGEASDDEIGAAGLIVAVGGDGTLLAASRLAGARGTPVLGVHSGGAASFGFLTETTPGGARAALEAVLAGRYRLETRLMVAAEVRREGTVVGCFHGLNDIVLRGQFRLLKMQISVGETFIATYAADGIIVATPTGSTAYNLAAGGPLVHPSVDTILLTPICPHTLNVRSLLVGVNDTIHVRLDRGSRDETRLTVDGQVGFDLEPGDRITFRRSEQAARFVTVDGAGFFQKVQTRLRLGERFGS